MTSSLAYKITDDGLQDFPQKEMVGNFLDGIWITDPWVRSLFPYPFGHSASPTKSVLLPKKIMGKVQPIFKKARNTRNSLKILDMMGTRLISGYSLIFVHSADVGCDQIRCNWESFAVVSEAYSSHTKSGWGNPEISGRPLIWLLVG